MAVKPKKKKKKRTERRRYSRKRAEQLAEVKVPRWERWERVPVTDIGQGGLGFFSHLPLDLGDPIQIRIRFGARGGARNSEVAAGKVAWIRPHAFFHIGVVFNGLDPQRHRRILQGIPSGHVGSQPHQTDRMVWKGWIRNLLIMGKLQRRDLLELAAQAKKKGAS
jgi:hypothetical protein